MHIKSLQSRDTLTLGIKKPEATRVLSACCHSIIVAPITRNGLMEMCCEDRQIGWSLKDDDIVVIMIIIGQLCYRSFTTWSITGHQLALMVIFSAFDRHDVGRWRASQSRSVFPMAFDWPFVPPSASSRFFSQNLKASLCYCFVELITFRNVSLFASYSDEVMDCRYHSPYNIVATSDGYGGYWNMYGN